MGEGSDDGRVIEWEIGLPSAEDLTPLSQSLIPPELASAFSISPEPFHSLLEVHRASHNTFSALLSLKSFPPFPSDDPMVDDVRRSEEEADSSAVRSENSDDDQSNRALKRPRLVWTSQLHKRFVDVVSHLGIMNAVPKTIMQLMNVEGLTRENVASHLQKYRLYLKRMQGLSNEEPSPSDLLFGSTPVPQSIQEQPMPAAPPMIPMPVFGMAHHNYGHNGPMSMMPVDNYQGNWGYHGNKLHHLYGGFGERSRDWSGGGNFGSIATYPRVFPNDK